MKKILATLICLILTAPYAFAYYGYTRRVPVLYTNTNANNVVIELGGKNMLLHYSGGCDAVANNEQVMISVRTVLDGYGDDLVMSSYQKCVIDQAEEINGVLIVANAYSGNSAVVMDDKGDMYYIQYGTECSRLPAYEGATVFLRRYGSGLAVGDKIYLPEKEGSCSIFYVDKYESSEEPIVEEKTEDDIKRPTSATNVTATPGNNSVSLNWRAASDNVAIDHYVVSYSQYSFTAKNYTYEEMPNKINTGSNKTNYVIKDLENEEAYFFYVIAVDTSGNISSDWSVEANATPKSSIMSWDTERKPVRLLIYKVQNTPDLFLFKWNRIPSFVRQTVTLDVDRVRDFGVTNWSRDYIHIYKNADRKGKALKLTVRQFDIYGQMFMKEYNFEF